MPLKNIVYLMSCVHVVEVLSLRVTVLRMGAKMSSKLVAMSQNRVKLSKVKTSV